MTIERMKKVIQIALVLLAAALVALIMVLVHEYNALRRENMSAILRSPKPLTAAEVGVIRPWMTFDYVNRLFALPPDFLKQAFAITDASYPRLTLSRVASERSTGAPEFTDAVDAAIAGYLQSTRQ